MILDAKYRGSKLHGGGVLWKIWAVHSTVTGAQHSPGSLLQI